MLPLFPGTTAPFSVDDNIAAPTDPVAVGIVAVVIIGLASALGVASLRRKGPDE